MAAPKIDCSFTVQPQYQENAQALSTGAAIRVVPDHAAATVSLQAGEGAVLAVFDKDERLLRECRGPCKGSVRTLRRDPATQAVQCIVVRVLPREALDDGSGAAGPAQAAREPPPVIDDGDEEAAALKLRREALEAVAADEGMLGFMRNAALREVVAGVDAAPDREQALKRALGNPEFAAFCSKVLDVVQPQGGAGGGGAAASGGGAQDGGGA